MNPTQKLIVLGIAASFILTSCLRSSAKSNQVAAADAVPVRVAQAVSEDVPLEISAVGNVEAIHTVEVRSRIAGQINRVALDEGQNVTKGQLLFQIDPEQLQRQAAEQGAELERDMAMDQQARAILARDTASLKQTQSEADVGLQLAKDGILAKQRADQLVTAVETAQAALHSDQAAIDAAVGTVKADRARLAQTQLQLSLTRVVSPIDGRAGAITVQSGNLVRDNDTTLLTLLQLAPIQVTFGLPEQFLPEVQRLHASRALAVEVRDEGGKSFEGGLDFIDNSINANTGAVRLKAVFPNADRALWPGEFVDVRLRLLVERARTVVPEACIQDGLDGHYVWLVRSGFAATAPVNVLRTYKPVSGSEQAVVANGIRPGDTVVSEGQLRLTPGVKVTLLDPVRN